MAVVATSFKRLPRSAVNAILSPRCRYFAVFGIGKVMATLNTAAAPTEPASPATSQAAGADAQGQHRSQLILILA